MSITLEINRKQLDDNDPLKVHYLPAKIDGDGEANVDMFFNNYTREENGYLSNALRGYPLQGEELIVPEGFNAVVFQETREPLNENADRILRVTGRFDRFNYWNYDKIPSKADGYKQALQMINIAEECAKPLTEDEVLEELEKRKKEAANKSN